MKQFKITGLIISAIMICVLGLSACGNSGGVATVETAQTQEQDQTEKQSSETQAEETKADEAVSETTQETESTAAASTSSGIAGVYKLIAMTTEGESVQADEIKTLEDMGMYAMLVVEEGNKAILNLFGTEVELTYDDTKFVSPTEELDYTFENGVISMGDDNDNMTFAKMTEEERQAAEASNEEIKNMLEELKDNLE